MLCVVKHLLPLRKIHKKNAGSVKTVEKTVRPMTGHDCVPSKPQLELIFRTKIVGVYWVRRKNRLEVKVGAHQLAFYAEMHHIYKRF
jgi:hypothetical protein